MNVNIAVSLPPNVEEHAKRVWPALRRIDVGRFHVNDAAGVVCMNPVETAAGEIRRKTNILWDLHRLAVIEER